MSRTDCTQNIGLDQMYSKGDIMNTYFNNVERGIGYFLSYEIWEKANELLQLQLKQKKVNKHYNTLNMYYFSLIEQDIKDVIAKEEYYNEKIKNNIFYGLEKEFFCYKYSIPKQPLGIRNYYFFSYPLLVVYYSIGLYMFKLTYEFIEEFYKEHENIRSFYGGKLRMNNDDIKINKDNIYYRNEYKEYKKLLKTETKNTDKKIIIKLDIKDYFDNVSIKKLLELVFKYIKPSIKSKYMFDNFTMENIRFYFDFLTSGQGGIPQSDNNIISSFIGHLFLVFSDLFIDDILKRNSKGLYNNNYKIIRYVDDINIVLEFNENVNDIDMKTITLNNTQQIMDMFYNEFSLRINNKTRLFVLKSQEDLSELLDGIKKVSIEENFSIKDLEENESDQTTSPVKSIEKIINEINKLKKQDLNTRFYFYRQNNIDIEILKDIYDKHVSNLMKKKEISKRIKELFSDFNFDLVAISPREIITIILKSEEAKENLKKYLLSKKEITMIERNMIVQYLNQDDFQDKDLFKKLNDDKYFKPIYEYINNAKNINLTDGGYYNLKFDKLVLIKNRVAVIKQIELRVMNEKLGNYSVALNHLVNEIHSICYYLENPNQSIKNYKIKDITRFLDLNLVPNYIVIMIKNLFDRRNNNLISHSGTDDNLIYGVSKEEYYEYKKYVGKCLEILLDKN